MLTNLLSMCLDVFAGSGSGKITSIYAHEKGTDNIGVILFRTENNSSKAECSTA